MPLSLPPPPSTPRPPTPPLLPPSPAVPPFAPVSAGQAVVQVQATVITINLQVAGDVNDFAPGSSALTNLDASFRSLLECYDPCQLRLLISSASVNVQALITVPNPPTGTAPNIPTANLAATVLAAATALTSQPAAALSVALAVTVTQAPAITVAENVAVPMVVAPPPPSSPSGSALDDVLSDLSSIQMATSTQTVIIISVVAGVCVLAIAIYLCRVRRGYKSRVHAITPSEPHPVINAANTELMSCTTVTTVTKVISICKMLPVTAQQTAGGANALDIGGDAAHTPGGMSWERGISEMGARAHAEEGMKRQSEAIRGNQRQSRGATAHAELGMKGSALQHEPAGYHVRTAWT